MRFALYTTAVSLFAIAGVTDALKLADLPQVGIAPTATVMAQCDVKQADEEQFRNKAIATVDSMRKGILALREAKVQGNSVGQEILDRMTQAAAEKQAAAERMDAAGKIQSPVITIKQVTAPIRPRPITGQMEACLDRCISKCLNNEEIDDDDRVKKEDLPKDSESESESESAEKVTLKMSSSSSEEKASKAKDGPSSSGTTDGPAGVRDIGKKIGDEMKQKIEKEVKQDVLKQAAATGDAKSVEQVMNPLAGSTPASALTPSTKTGGEDKRTKSDASGKDGSSKTDKPKSDSGKPNSDSEKSKSDAEKPKSDAEKPKSDSEKSKAELEKEAAVDMEKKGIITKEQREKAEKKLDEEIKSQPKTATGSKPDPSKKSDTSSTGAESKPISSGKLDEINSAAAGFMEKVKALNGGVDKTISDSCCMQAEQVKAINEASQNFKAAVDALNRSTADNAIINFKCSQKDGEKPQGQAAPIEIMTGSGKRAVVSNAVVRGDKVEFDAAFEK